MKTVFDEVKSTRAVDPIAASSVQTSAAIDTIGYGSAVVVVTNGAATGTPSSYTVDAKVQHCATSGGSYEDVSGAAITQITTDGAQKTIRLDGLNSSVRRYIKVLVTPALSGGSSPKALVGATVHFGRTTRGPVGNSQ